MEKGTIGRIFFKDIVMMIERYQQRGHENELKNQVDGVVLIEVRFTNHILFYRYLCAASLEFLHSLYH